MNMKLALAIMGIATGAVGCANDPQYVKCGSADTKDVCELNSQDGSGMGDSFSVSGSLHVPVMPADSSLKSTTAALQKTMPTGVTVPVYRLDQYDLALDYSITNYDGSDTQAAIALNGANEVYAWQPSLIMPTSDESPPPPSLQGGTPIYVPANSTVTGQFTADDLLEAAIDLDEISRGNINMYQATLIDTKDEPSFQPLTPQQPPTTPDGDSPPQDDMGSAVPRAAFRQLVRLDVTFLPSDPTVHLELKYSMEVVPHIDNVISDMGMNAPSGQVMIYDPPAFVPTYTP